MKKIGMIDYYLSEWHANNYPAWISEANAALGTDYEVTYAWAEMDVSPVDGVTTEQWCRKNGVTRCDTISRVCELSDVLMILAPSDPQTHLKYVKEVFPFGKRTYVDKTFASDLSMAEEIFEIAGKYGTPFFSSSALRFATEVGSLPEVEKLMTVGGGTNFAEYIIHLAEMNVAVLKDPVRKVRVTRKGSQRVCDLITDSGKEATVLYAVCAPYMIAGETEDNRSVGGRVKSEFFKELVSSILRFFENGATPFDRKETLEVMRLRDLLIRADENSGEWICR